MTIRNQGFFALVAFLCGCPAGNSSDEGSADTVADTAEVADANLDVIDVVLSQCPIDQPSGTCAGDLTCQYGHGPACYLSDYGAVTCKCAQGSWSCTPVRYDCPAIDASDIDATSLDAPESSDEGLCVPPPLPACPETQCGPVTDLTDEAALRAYLASATWTDEAAWCTVMNEVRFPGTAEISAADFQATLGCKKPPCTPSFIFVNEVPGVTCVGASNLLTLCPKVRFQNAQFRLRPARLVADGIALFVSPVLGIVGPCAEPCATGEAACPNHTCFPMLKPPSNGLVHCKWCRGGEDNQCSCWDENGPLPDGTECQGHVGDVVWSGHCRCGYCDEK